MASLSAREKLDFMGLVAQGAVAMKGVGEAGYPLLATDLRRKVAEN